MDRARAAGYIDNNFVQNQQRIRKRKDHLARLQKIKSRKPGSSVTLDNNAPVVLQSAAEDPRKKARKGISSIIIERENKVLLQRISAILLEPAKNTLEEYNTMKKLIVPKNAGKARAFEQHVQKVRNEKFFENLRKQKAVYNVKKWEEDYRVQKTNQRFMREVKYERPPGFVDPFTQPPPSSSSPSDPRDRHKHSTPGEEGKSPGRESNSAAHVHRIRNMRHDRSSSALNSGMRHKDKGGAEHTARAGSNSGGKRTGMHQGGHDGGTASGYYDGDAFEDDDDYGPEDGEEFRELLAEAHREVRVSEEVVHQHQYQQSPQQRGRSQHARAVTTSEAKLHVYLANADVQCWLVNSELIVLSAEVHEGGRLLSAEAEISLEDLAILRGEDPALLASGGSTANSVSHRDGETVPLQDGASSVLSMGFDMQTLQQMAQEMVAHVELRVDAESGARLILNLVSEEDALLLDVDSDATAGAGTVNGRNPPGNATQTGTSHSHGGGQKPEANESLLNEEELGDMLIDDDRQVVLTMGARVPVHFENQVITASVANLGTLIDAAKIKDRKECVYALVKVVSTEEDQLAATLYVMSSTVTQFKRFARPAVVKGTILKINTALPSVVHADPELVHTFARNMVASIKVVHSNRTGKNSLTVDNVG